MNKTALITLLVILTAIVASSAYAKNYTASSEFDLVLFYGKGCPHCAKEEIFLQEMEDKYPTLKVHRFEVYFNDTDREMMQSMAAAYKTEVSGVPMTFIDDKVITGFSDAIGKNIENEIRSCVENGCGSPFEKVASTETVTITGDASPTEHPDKQKTTETITIGAVIAGAAVDSINPCEFAVLIILLTTILAAGVRKRVLWAGISFTLAIYLSYFLMGLGLYSAITAAGITHTFYIIVAALAIVVGLFNLKDYLWYGKWFLMEVPLSWRPAMKGLIKSVTSVPGAFLVGIVVSLFLLPCTSGPYIVILGLLAKTATKASAIPLLLLYNFIFVLPMLIITCAIYFGFTTTQKAEEWRTRKLKVLHLIAGALMVIMGIGMFVGIWLGIV
jgi:cytochrome c biogenesis protein CcdA/glutaredoxin